MINAFSSATFDCVMVENVLVFNSRNSSSLQQGSQNHQLRKTLISDHGGKKSVSLALFLCFSQHSQFCLIQPKMVDGQFQLIHQATVYAPEVNTDSALGYDLPESG